jgi:hypothetical protein
MDGIQVAAAQAQRTPLKTKIANAIRDNPTFFKFHPLTDLLSPHLRRKITRDQLRHAFVEMAEAHDHGSDEYRQLAKELAEFGSLAAYVAGTKAHKSYWHNSLPHMTALVEVLELIGHSKALAALEQVYAYAQDAHGDLKSRIESLLDEKKKAGRASGMLEGNGRIHGEE